LSSSQLDTSAPRDLQDVVPDIKASLASNEDRTAEVDHSVRHARQMQGKVQLEKVFNCHLERKE